MALDVQATKGVTLVLFLVLTLFLGFLPMLFGKCVDPNKKSHQIVISSLLCFGGGVLLATSLLHMLTEVRETFEVLELKAHIPLAEIFICIGFFMVYFIEELVQSCINRGRSDTDISQSRQISEMSISSSPSLKKDPHSMEAKVNEMEGQQNEAQGPSHMAVKDKGGVKDLLIVVALSFHAIFEGLAAGLQKTAAHVWALYAAVALHKYVIAFCIGLELFSNKNAKRLTGIIYMSIFASMSPLGIGIGIGLTSSFDEEAAYYQIMIGVLQGLAAGTLLYVAVFEILEREKNKASVNGLLQLFFAVLGFIVMTISQVFLPEPE